MPIWSEILRELAESSEVGQPPDFDGVRRQYLSNLSFHTGRSVILYASAWLQKTPSDQSSVSIYDEDIQGFMEVCHGLSGPDLDLILHSPGGSPDTAEAIVAYLRSRFNDIRVFVPQQAMSAATMIACAADEIWMGSHSFLGPTDPQFVLGTALGLRLVSALDVLDQFDRAVKECQEPEKMAAWLPMLSQYGPDLLSRSETAVRMSQDLVGTWLEQYMFKWDDQRREKAARIATWLASRREFLSHSRHISRDTLQENGLAVRKLEDNHALQDLCLSAFHATTHAFSRTNAVKIIENHMGRAFIKFEPQPQTD